MKMVLIYILVLVLAAMQSCDAMSTEKCPHHHIRHKRDVDTQHLSEACWKMLDCHHTSHERFISALVTFHLEELYDHLNEWCLPTTNCWNDDCHNETHKQTVQRHEAMFHWICDNRERFEDKSCYQDPFPSKIKACVREFIYNLNQMEILEKYQKLVEMGKCIRGVLQELPGCQGNHKNTFLNLMNNYMQQFY